MAPRVLLVAPHSDLPGVDDELEDVLTSGLDVDPLLGDVRVQDVTRRLRKGCYDAALFAGHGSSDGVHLSTTLLSASTLTAAARTGRVGVLYLNTCESEGVGRQVANDSAADCICWIGLADDGQAAHTMALWSAEYARSGDARAAFEAAKPANNTSFVYLTGKPTMHDGDSRDVAAMIDRFGHSLTEQIKGLDARMQQLEKRVGQVEQRVGELDDNVDAKLDNIIGMIPPMSAWRLVAWLTGFVFLLAPPLAFYWLHDADGWPRVGLVWGVLGVQAVCVPFFMYGSGFIREPKVRL